MTTGRSGTIGVIVGDVENPYFGQAVRGISDVARAAGFDVILANSGEDLEKERDAVRVFLGKRVDGLIISPARITDIGASQEVRQVRAPARSAGSLYPFLGCRHRRLRMIALRRQQQLGSLSRQATDGSAMSPRRIVMSPAYKGPHQIHLSTVLDRIEGFLDAATNAGIRGSEGYHPSRCEAVWNSEKDHL